MQRKTTERWQRNSSYVHTYAVSDHAECHSSLCESPGLAKMPQLCFMYHRHQEKASGDGIMATAPLTSSSWHDCWASPAASASLRSGPSQSPSSCQHDAVLAEDPSSDFWVPWGDGSQQFHSFTGAMWSLSSHLQALCAQHAVRHREARELRQGVPRSKAPAQARQGPCWLSALMRMPGTCQACRGGTPSDAKHSESCTEGLCSPAHSRRHSRRHAALFSSSLDWLSSLSPIIKA